MEAVLIADAREQGDVRNRLRKVKDATLTGRLGNVVSHVAVHDLSLQSLIQDSVSLVDRAFDKLTEGGVLKGVALTQRPVNQVGQVVNESVDLSLTVESEPLVDVGVATLAILLVESAHIVRVEQRGVAVS